MNQTLTRTFYIACISFLILPFLIFMLGWLSLAVSIPLVLLCCGSLWWWLRKAEFPEIPFVENRRTIFFAFLLTTCWVFASGIGGFTYQNYDHYYRNAMLFDLTLREDPDLVLAFHTQGETIYWRFFDRDIPGSRELGEALSRESGYSLEDTPYVSGFAGSFSPPFNSY